MRVPSHVSCGGIAINMAPMIDVVFQLLIYFLCAASFAVPEQVLPATMPPVGAATNNPPKEVQELELIRIALSQSGELHINLNGSPCPSVAELRDRLRQLRALADLPAVLDVSPAVELGHVVTIYDTCLVVGLKDIRFSAPER